MKKLLSILGIIGALIPIIYFGTDIGNNLAYASDIQRVTQSQYELRLEFKNDKLKALESKLLEHRVKVYTDFESKGLVQPPVMFEYAEDIKHDIKNLNKEIEDIKDNIERLQDE